LARGQFAPESMLIRLINEKRARRKRTRPEPTIFGNCDSWSFIVGKKAGLHRPENRAGHALWVHNGSLMHKLFTGRLISFWTTYGKCVDHPCTMERLPTWWFPAFSIYLKPTKQATDSIQNRYQAFLKLVTANFQPFFWGKFPKTSVKGKRWGIFVQSELTLQAESTHIAPTRPDGAAD